MPEMACAVRTREGLGRGSSALTLPPPPGVGLLLAALHVAAPGLVPRPTTVPGEWGAAAGPLGPLPFLIRRSLPGQKETCWPLSSERPAVFSWHTCWLRAAGTPSSLCDRTRTLCWALCRPLCWPPRCCPLLSHPLPARPPDLASTHPVLRAVSLGPAPDRACALRKVTLVPRAWGHSREPFLDPRGLKCHMWWLCRGPVDTWAVFHPRLLDHQPSKV